MFFKIQKKQKKIDGTVGKTDLLPCVVVHHSSWHQAINNYLARLRLYSSSGDERDMTRKKTHLGEQTRVRSMSWHFGIMSKAKNSWKDGGMDRRMDGRMNGRPASEEATSSKIAGSEARQTDKA